LYEQSQHHRRRVRGEYGSSLGDDQWRLSDRPAGRGGRVGEGQGSRPDPVGPIAGHAIDATGTTDYADTAGSDIVIITAGVARKPGMTREDLVHINAGYRDGRGEAGRHYSPNCIIIMMTNPLDTMTYLAYKASGFPRERVIGQAGVLDGGRMRTFIAMQTGISPENIHTTVLGGHGDEMVPLVRFSTIAACRAASPTPSTGATAAARRVREPDVADGRERHGDTRSAGMGGEAAQQLSLPAPIPATWRGSRTEQLRYISEAPDIRKKPARPTTGSTRTSSRQTMPSSTRVA
jgi:hypothetical protein